MGITLYYAIAKIISFIVLTIIIVFMCRFLPSRLIRFSVEFVEFIKPGVWYDNVSLKQGVFIREVLYYIYLACAIIASFAGGTI